MTQHVPGLIADGLLEGDADEIGHVFWAAIHGAVVLQLAGKLTAEFDFERLYLPLKIERPGGAFLNL